MERVRGELNDREEQVSGAALMVFVWMDSGCLLISKTSVRLSRSSVG